MANCYVEYICNHLQCIGMLCLQSHLAYQQDNWLQPYGWLSAALKDINATLGTSLVSIQMNLLSN